MDSATAIQEMLIGYRSTPHPATGISPYEALMKRQVRTKLGYIQRKHNDREITEEKEINERDKCYKEKIKHKAENRNTRKHDFKIGDYVLLEQNKRDKWSTAYEPAFYNIFVINGSTVGVRRVSDGREIYRDASKSKLANALIKDDENGPPARQAREGAEDEDYGPPRKTGTGGGRLERGSAKKNRIQANEKLCVKSRTVFLLSIFLIFFISFLFLKLRRNVISVLFRELTMHTIAH